MKLSCHLSEVIYTGYSYSPAGPFGARVGEVVGRVEKFKAQGREMIHPGSGNSGRVQFAVVPASAARARRAKKYI